MKPMIVVVADTHIFGHQQFATIGPDGMNSRVRIVLDKLIEAAKWGRDREVPYFVHLGDVFHTRDFISYRIWNAAFETFRTVCSTFHNSFFVIGNHDILGNQAGYTIDAFRAIPNVQIVDRAIDYPLIGEGVRFIPWLWKDHVTTPDLEHMNEAFRTSPTSVILAHCPIKGATLNPLANQLWDDGVTLESQRFNAFIGHCHIRQAVAMNAFHLGSLCPVTAAEDRQAGGFGVVNDDGSLQIIDNDAPRFITVRRGQEVAAGELKGNYVRVERGCSVTLDLAEEMGAIAAIELESEQQTAKAVEWSRFDDLKGLADAYADENHGGLDVERLKSLGKGLLCG